MLITSKGVLKKVSLVWLILFKILKPGDIFSFNNRRLLHGRTEFDPNSGHRHLQGYYMDRDEIIGRLRYLKSSANSNQ